MPEPTYEIWGGWTDDPEGGYDEDFLEDCCTLDEAKAAIIKYGRNFFAYCRDKNTGQPVRLKTIFGWMR